MSLGFRVWGNLNSTRGACKGPRAQGMPAEVSGDDGDGRSKGCALKANPNKGLGLRVPGFLGLGIPLCSRQAVGFRVFVSRV